MIEELKEHVYGYNELGDPEFVGPPTREELKDKIRMVQYEMNCQEEKLEDIINHFAAKITAAKFHVDGAALIRNYLKMTQKDAKKAWEVLITNPAYFSPIKTTDAQGKTILNPTQATEENQKLAKFLKGLKG